MEKNKIQITIYIMTGKQGLFVIPKNWCQECDLLIALVKNIVKESNLADKVEIKIRPWFLWAPLPFFRHFAWDPPILVINGKLVSQGVVPPKQQIIDKITG